MISPVSHPKKTESPSFLKAFQMLPLWERSSKSALRVLASPAPTPKANPLLKMEAATSVSPFPIYSQADKAHIADLLKIFDETSIPGLSFKMFRLAEIDASVEHLHPFTLLKVILTDPVLKTKMKRIYEGKFKRLGMMSRNFAEKGFGYKLDRENKKGTLEPNIEAFARSLHLPAEKIRPLIQAGAWIDLCCYLIEHTLPKQDAF